MELTFPFKNLAFNSLLDFFDPQKILEFIESGQSVDEFFAEDFESVHLQENIPSFESELLQVINTTNQETIDHYFNVLVEEEMYLTKLLYKENLLKTVKKWNEEKLAEFNNSVEKKTEDYANHHDRKRGHLEEFEHTTFGYPLFGLGKSRNVKKSNYNFYCVEDKFSYIDPERIDNYLLLLKRLSELFLNVVRKYYHPWENGEIRSQAAALPVLKPIVFCEGEIDVELIKKAAEHLDKSHILEKIDLRYRGGYPQLDKLWGILKEINWETIPQKKILLYDGDTKRPDEDFGHIYRRTVPIIEENPIKTGIENLFPEHTIKRATEHKIAFFDIKKTSGTERGIPFEINEYAINKQEKRNFCNWILETGTKGDFVNYSMIFEIVEEFI